MNNNKGMLLMLHIDTATEAATVSVSKNGTVIHSISNNNQKNHASFLQPAVKQLLLHSGISIQQLSAVSVTEGPGSYTGLRVGMASAKGLCYALKIPLITLGTLEVMALSVIENTSDPGGYYYCPMIDARRMEVFTALFDDNLNVIIPPAAVVPEPLFLNEMGQDKRVIISGNGAKKFNDFFNIQSFIFIDTPTSVSAQVIMSIKKFNAELFTPVITAHPLYIKEFLTIS